MQPNDAKKRIVLLDSFRCLAILFVILYHFTYRWTPPYSDINLYPYSNWYGNIFKYGYLGVSFFFIISGFVISFTLEGTENIGAFFKNRFIRLFPSMLLCSIITFTIVYFLDRDKIFPPLHNGRNFLPSLTFINPDLFNRILNLDFDWLNGSYWSLWVEIQFYIISSVVYFLNKKRYFVNILLTSFIISLSGKVLDNICCRGNRLHIPASNIVKSEISFWSNNAFDITQYIQFFAVGVVFHKLYKEAIRYDRKAIALSAITFLVSFIYVKNKSEAIIIAGMHILFLLMIYKPGILSFLNNTLFIRIGVLSYTIYLIHEPIGILSIKHFGPYLGRLSPLAPWILMVLIILFAELSYRLYEKNTYRFLKKRLFRHPVSKPSLTVTN